MGYNIKNSIDRAIKLMRRANDYDDYVSLKIAPFPKGCCCFHCWPETWRSVNEYIYPQGPIEDEGDVLLKENGKEFVLECHESGPEIVIIATVSIALVTAIINLIATLVSALRKDRKCPTKIRIIKKKLTKGKVNEEEIIEMDLTASANSFEKQKRDIENAVKESLLQNRS